MMNRVLVWDLPTRLFHALLTVCVLASLGLAMATDDDSLAFQIHKLLGLLAVFLVALRLVWGFVGTRYARFGSFLFGPAALFGYLRGVLRPDSERHTGHNPGSAWAIFAMLTFPLGLAATGLLLPGNHAFEEPHEAMAHLMTLVVLMHLAGIALHTFRFREAIALSMVDGKKVAPAADAIPSSRPLVGLVFLGLSLAAAVLLFRGHDPRSSTVSFLGLTLPLGGADEEGDEEGEHEASGDGEREDRGRGGGRREREDDD